MSKTVEINKKSLIQFIKRLKKHSENIDYIMKEFESYEIATLIADEMNKYDFTLDSFFHFDLDIPLDKLNKILNKSFKL